MRVSVTFTPFELESRDTGGAVVVVIDVFRASTTIARALSAGAECILPFLSIDEAFEEKAARPRALLAGERGGRRIDGFDLGNSPREFTPEIVGGREIIMTTTNGTRLLRAAMNADRLIVAGFVNLSATATVLSAEEQVVLACAGTETRFSIEDALCAGALARELSESANAALDDGAAFAAALCRRPREDLRALALSGRGAANVVKAGLEGDLADCLAPDAFEITAVVKRRPLRVIAESMGRITGDVS